jgi:hypothetical protein
LDASNAAVGKKKGGKEKKKKKNKKKKKKKGCVVFDKEFISVQLLKLTLPGATRHNLRDDANDTPLPCGLSDSYVPGPGASLRICTSWPGARPIE